LLKSRSEPPHWLAEDHVTRPADARIGWLLSRDNFVESCTQNVHTKILIVIICCLV
jgi:hypothetical protein